MVEIKEKKIRNMGDYHYISIPKALIDNGILSLNKKYRIIFEEIKDQVQSKNQSQSQEAT